MKKILVVVDCQNDFIDGTLGTPEAQGIVDKVVDKIKNEDWDLIYTTQDTHDEDYLNTQEGRNLPIEHCIEGTNGWCINEKIVNELWKHPFTETLKGTFGSLDLADTLLADMVLGIKTLKENECELTLIGVCTDICVVSNALLLKACFPEMRLIVDASCCAGSTPEKHKAALEVMRSCQIDVINEE